MTAPGLSSGERARFSYPNKCRIVLNVLNVGMDLGSGCHCLPLQNSKFRWEKNTFCVKDADKHLIHQSTLLLSPCWAYNPLDIICLYMQVSPREILLLSCDRSSGKRAWASVFLRAPTSPMILMQSYNSVSVLEDFERILMGQNDCPHYLYLCRFLP